MTKAEMKAHWAIPDETLGDGYTLTHKREREAYVKGYHQAITDACEWLQNHNGYLRVHDNSCGVGFDMTQCVIDFRKAMEE